MRAPEFWTTGAGPWPYLLAPAGWIYGAAGAVERSLTRGHKAAIPIICVGNLTAGGTGKTPVALTLARLLGESGAVPGFLSRGYGGRARGPLRVDPKAHGAGLVGDEALLLAASGPTWIADKRAAAVGGLIDAGIGVIILDDGHQDPALAKDFSIIVVDGETGFGNGRCIPAGPLREPVGAGLARAELVIVMGEDRAGVRECVAALDADLPVFSARLVPSPAAAALRGRRVFAFAGIGRPENFRATLEEIGVDLQGFRAFPDHHAYSADDAATLLGEAAATDALAVTTVKDRVRLPATARAQVTVVEVEAVFGDEAGLRALISGAIASWAAPEGPDQGG